MSGHTTEQYASMGVAVRGGAVPYYGGGAGADAPPAPLPRARAPRGPLVLLIACAVLSVLVLVGDAVALGVDNWARSGGYGFHFGPFRGYEEGDTFSFLTCKESQSYRDSVCACCNHVGTRTAPLLILASVLHFFGTFVLIVVTVFHKQVGRANSALKVVPFLVPVLFALSAFFFFITPIVFSALAKSSNSSCQSVRYTYGMQLNGGGFVVACLLAFLSPILCSLSVYAVMRLRTWGKHSGTRVSQWRARFGEVDDAELGATACCCPAYLYGTTRHRLKGEAVGEEACKYALLQCFCSTCLLSAPARGEMRAQLQIGGDGCGDCLAHTFCAPCALAQERMEIDARLRDGSHTMPNSVVMVRPAQQSLLAGTQHGQHEPLQQQQHAPQQQQQAPQYPQQQVYSQPYAQQGQHYAQAYKVMDIPGRVIATAEQRAAAAKEAQEQEEE